MKITNLFPLWILLSPSVKGSLSFPVFQFWKQLNIHEVFCKIVWGTEGVSLQLHEKDVFIQMQNSVVSSKVLVLVNCLNTYVHGYSYSDIDLNYSQKFVTFSANIFSYNLTAY